MIMNFNHLKTLLFAVFYTGALLLFGACSSSNQVSKDYLYFKNGVDTVAISRIETTIHNGDLLTIQVLSRTTNQEQAAIFNIPTSSTQTQGYQVNGLGEIQYPILGSIKATGLTINQLEVSLTQKLINYVKNPTVIVHFAQFNVNVLGEVKTPGTQKFQVDKVTIIDAIGAAGDLTDYGMRDNVTVIREENNKKIYYNVDLTNKALFRSPVYILHPNDIIYVSPNSIKLKTLNSDPNAQRKTGTVLSILSVVISIATLVVFSRR
jgi:polysaccharide biosynthesis/export protein